MILLQVKNGFYLHTEGFNFEECYKLVGILHYNFDLICTVQKHNNKPMIYITAKSFSKFCVLVFPYFNDSMKYKLLS